MSVVIPVTLGIDIGSLTCRVAELNVSKPMPIILRNKSANESTPSIAYFPVANSGPRDFGESVQSKEVSDADHTVADLKHWLLTETQKPRIFLSAGPKSEDEEDPSDLTLLPSQVTGFVMRHLLNYSSCYMAAHKEPTPSDPSNVSENIGGLTSFAAIGIAVPPVYTDNAEVRSAILKAFQLANIGTKGEDKTFENALNNIPVYIVDETDALAAYYHHQRYSELTDTNCELTETTTKPTVIVNVGHRFTTIVVIVANKEKVTKIASAAIYQGASLIDDGLCKLVFEHIKTKNNKDISNHKKSFNKVLRDCRKAKALLSSAESAMISIEGLVEDIDVNTSLTRGQVDLVAAPLLAAIDQMVKTDIMPAILEYLGVEGLSEDSVIVEAVGGGWRPPCVQNLLKNLFNVTKLGVRIDANLCVAEGASIAAGVMLEKEHGKLGDENVTDDDQGNENIEVKEKCYNTVHGVEIIGMKTAKIVRDETNTLSNEWETLEYSLKCADDTYFERLSIMNRFESTVFQIRDLAARCGGDTTLSAEKAKDLENILSAADNFIFEVQDQGSHSAIHLKDLEDRMASLKTDTIDNAERFPELRAQMTKEEDEERKKTEELERLSKMQQEDKELKTDPQRFRVAQQRKEQGTKLFQTEDYEDAQTRFVQALSILGTLYDSTSDDHKKKKNEISLSCHLNIASCSIKLQRNWRIAISNCTSALDIHPDHPKALYRRGQAYSGQGDYREALEDLVKALHLSNNDPAVAAEIEYIKTKKAHEEQKQKKMFSKMFA
eukprot:Tbor_TRINITY_DN4356_c0_g2::TRINITY_DN4356_c0_g2_i1::g.7697::m.7697